MSEANDARTDTGPFATRMPLVVGVTTLWVALLPLLPRGVRLGALPVLDAERVGFVVVLVLLLAQLWRGLAVRRAMNAMETGMVLFVGVIVLSWFSTLSAKSFVTIRQDADFLLGSFAAPLTAYYVGRSARWTPARVVICLSILIGVTGMSLILLGIVQGTYDWGFLVEESVRKIHRDRAKGPFGDSIRFGLVAAMLLPLALYLYLELRSRAGRLVAIAIALGLTEAIILSKARAVWIGLIVAVTFAAVRCSRLRGLAAAIVLLLVVQIGLASGGSDAKNPHQMRARLTESGTVFNRVAIWVTDINMASHRPLFGFGFGLSTFLDNREQYFTSCCGIPVKYAYVCGVPHNELLNVLILTGGIGLLAYLVFVRGVWRFLAATAETLGEHSSRASLALCLQAVVITLAILSLTHDLMYMRYVQLLFFYLLGIAAGDWAAPVRAGVAHR